MKLTELDARFVGAGGEGVYHTAPDGTLVPAPERHGVGVTFRCPCGTHPRDDGRDDDYGTDRCTLLFNNPLDGGGRFDSGRSHWDRTGDTIETLTLTPSIQRVGGCGWHGYITAGETRTV